MFHQFCRKVIIIILIFISFYIAKIVHVHQVFSRIHFHARRSWHTLTTYSSLRNLVMVQKLSKLSVNSPKKTYLHGSQNLFHFSIFGWLCKKRFSRNPILQTVIKKIIPKMIKKMSLHLYSSIYWKRKRKFQIIYAFFYWLINSASIPK